MTYPFVQAFHDLGTRKGPVLGFVVHMAEGGGTVGFLSRRNSNGVSVHYVLENSGRIVQMLREDHMHSSIRTSSIRITDDADGFFGRTAAKAVLGTWADITSTLGPNHATIAVEIEGFAATGLKIEQADALAALVDDVRGRYPNIGLLGHRDFADYKACPGRLIPWDRLGGHGVTAAMGLQITLPAAPLVGRLAIVKGTDAIRVSDKAHYAVPVDVVRPAYAVNLTGANSGQGYIVDLNGDEAHFIRAEAATFTPPPPDTTPYGEADIARAVNAALDHVAPTLAAVSTAIAEARH